MTGLRGGEGPQGGMRGEQAIDRFSGRRLRLQEDVIAAGDGHPFAVRVGFDHHAYAAAALYAEFSGQYDAHAEGLVGTEQRAGPLGIRQQDDRLPAVPCEGVEERIAASCGSRVQPETVERCGGHFVGGPAAAIDGYGRRKALLHVGQEPRFPGSRLSRHLQYEALPARLLKPPGDRLKCFGVRHR
ncbi:hypothetical protein [Streptomyces platensis]|uniref:hypothetical protein n=1 Tax=Streptomyces platensis TaxID=58346 RepID=UPI00332B3F29